jgi:hypothetical protein
MPVPMKHDVQHYRGDSLALQLRVWQDVDNTVPADFSAAAVVAQIRTVTESPDIVAEFDVTVTGNTLTLVLDPKQSRELPPTCVFDVEVDWAFATDPDVNVQTVLAGSLAVASDVTRGITP